MFFHYSLTLLITLSCFSAANSGCKAKTSSDCEHRAVVIDKSGLDGCTLLLKLEDGSEMLPVNLGDFRLNLAAGDEVTITYQLVEDGMSICMAQDAMISLECIQLTTNASADCEPVIDPFEVQWMKAEIRNSDPVRIEEHTVDERVFVHFLGQQRARRVFTCSGILICESGDSQLDYCDTFQGNEGSIRVVYVTDNDK